MFSKLGISNGNNRSSGNETFVFQVDGRTFFEIMRGEAEQYFKRTGRAAFQGSGQNSESRINPVFFQKWEC